MARLGKLQPVGFRLGQENTEFVSVMVDGYTYPHSNDFDDDNWVRARVECVAGGFRGKVAGQLRTVEFRDFLEDIGGMIKGWEDIAEFLAMEDWFSITLEQDDFGDYRAECLLMDEVGTGNTLDFALTLDESEIDKLVNDLRNVCQAFPVREHR